MKKYMYIGCGGLLGAILRYAIETTRLFGYHGVFPLNTWVINLAGSFLLAVILTLAMGAFKMDDSVRLGCTAGFLGAFTTFSTLCKEGVLTTRAGHGDTAALYLGSSILLGLAAAWLGAALANVLIRKVLRERGAGNP